MSYHHYGIDPALVERVKFKDEKSRDQGTH